MFKYSINYYDNDLEKQSHDCGIIGTMNIEEAATKVSDFYGGVDCINSLLLEPLEDFIIMDDLIDLFTKH